MADRLDDAEFDDVPGQQAQGPGAVAFRERAEAQSDDPGLLLAIEQLGGRRGGAALAVEGLREALEHAAAAHVLDGGDAAAAGLGGLAISPGVGAGGGGVQQDAGAARLLAGAGEPLQGVLANRAFLVREPDDILLEHGVSSSEADSLTQPPKNILYLNVRFDKTLDWGW